MFLKKKYLINIVKFSKILIFFKKKLLKIKFKKKLIFIKKKELERLYDINIEYLEIRNKKNLRTSNRINNSKIFLGYYLNNIRLIDNF